MNNNFFKNFLGKTGFNSKPINSFEDEEDDEELTFENQKQEDGKQKQKDILFSNTIQQEELSKKRNDLINELDSNLTPAQILYSTVDELENLKENNKSKQDIDNLTFKTKDDNEENKEKPTGGASSVNMTLTEELYKRKKDEKDKQESEYKSKLLNILGDEAKPTDVLYGTTKKLEEKVKEYGLQNKSKGVMTGGAVSINKQEISNKTGDYGFDKSIINIRHYDKLSEEYNKEVGDFLRKNTNNPKEFSNYIRHQFVSAIFARNLGDKATKILGDLNEFKPADLLDPIDSKIDKINNEIGRDYAKQYPNMSREQLLKLMLKEYPKNKQLIIKKINEKTDKQRRLEREYL